MSVGQVELHVGEGSHTDNGLYSSTLACHTDRVVYLAAGTNCINKVFFSPLLVNIPPGTPGDASRSLTLVNRRLFETSSAAAARHENLWIRTKSNNRSNK